MIDLNSFLFNEKITKQDILNHVSQYQIFRYYIDEDFNVGTPFCSPLRNDSVPSFGIFNSRVYHDTLLFKDLATDQVGDCIVLVMKMFNVTYVQALLKIAADFGLIDYTTTDERVIKEIPKDKKIVSAERINIGISARPWAYHDKRFWKQFGITKATLKRYRVTPIKWLFFNNNPVKVDEHTYAFMEIKDGVTTYKIYQPYSKTRKWINNHDYSIWQGWEQMPENGELLIITSSLKDSMSIIDVAGYPSVSLQAETTRPKDNVVDELKSRFKVIYVLYDNDYDKDTNWGRKYGKRLADSFDLQQIEIHEKYRSKDFSDLTKTIGIHNAKDALIKLII